MSSTPVRRDQFKIRSASGRPAQGKQDPGQLGNVLPNGEDYRLHEMQAMMELLWAEYVDANPLFSRCMTRRPPWCRRCDISAARHSRVLIRLTLSTFD